MIEHVKKQKSAETNTQIRTDAEEGVQPAMQALSQLIALFASIYALLAVCLTSFGETAIAAAIVAYQTMTKTNEQTTPVSTELSLNIIVWLTCNSP